MLRVPAAAASGPPVVGRRVRRGRALFIGFASLVVAGVAAWYFSAPTADPPRRAPLPPAPTASPPPAKPKAAAATTAPAKAIEPVRVLLVPDPAPARPVPVAAAEPVAKAQAGPTPIANPPAGAPPAGAAPALVFEAPTRRAAAPAPEPIAPVREAAPSVAKAAPAVQLAAAAPALQETRLAPVALAPVTREVPDFPREALQAGVSQGTVKARVTVDAAGRVSAVDIVDAEPRRVFDRAVTRSLLRWTFAPGADGRTTQVEIAFRRD
jgi:TonB family protein